jgi:hypothetical protein
VSGKATFYIEEIYTDFIVTLGNKMLKYFKDIVDDGDSDRLRELEDIVGQAHATALQEIKNIPMRNLGLYIENTLTGEQKEQIMAIAQSMASAGTLDIETAIYLNIVDNIKQAYAILMFKKHAMDKKIAQQKQEEQQNQLALLDKTHQIELSKIQATGQVKQDLEKVIFQLQKTLSEAQINLKGHWTILSKEQINQNRIEEQMNQSHLEKLNAPGEVAA